MSKLTINLDDANDITAGIALLQMISGNTGAAPAPASAARPAPAAAAAGAARPAPGANKPAPARPAPAATAQSSKLAQMAEAISNFAKAYGPKVTKARFGEVSAALTEEYGYEVAFTKTSDIPEDHVDSVLPWFEVAA